MKSGDLVNHILPRGWGIGVVVGLRLPERPGHGLNKVYNVAWQSIGTIEWAWDYDLELVSESR